MLKIALALGWLVGFCLASAGQNNLKPEDFLVTALPDLLEGTPLPEIHSGLIEVGSHIGVPQSSLFFYHVKSKSSDAKTTIVWFNGGPGCSSMDGNFLEVGPLRFNKDGKLVAAPEGSWDENANLLFIDQPFGTGYSDPDENTRLSKLADAGDAVVAFFDEYAKIFPEFLDKDVYLAGESFAGQYIPYIWQSLGKNKEVNDKLGGIKGMILGNPWIDPANQYLSYPQFIKDNKLIPTDSWTELDQYNDKCIYKLSSYTDGIPINVDACENVVEYALKLGGGDTKHCFNIYKISETSPYPACGMEWPTEVPAMTSWLSKPEVKEALHVNSSGNWRECSTSVGGVLRYTSEPAAIHLLPKILEEVPVLLMVGDKDFICNKDGLDRAVKNLEWNGGVGLSQDLPDKTDYGSWVTDRNLTVAHITDGSHMAPVDSLKITHDIVHRFVYGTGETPPTGNEEEGHLEPEPTNDYNTDNSSNDVSSDSDASNSENSDKEHNTQDDNQGDKESDSKEAKSSRKFFIGVLFILIIAMVILGLIFFRKSRKIRAPLDEEFLMQNLDDESYDQFEIEDDNDGANR